MSGRRRLAKLGLLCLLVAAFGWIVFLRASSPQVQPLAWTSCTLDGPVRMMDVHRIAAEDTQPVRMHEDVHASQCATLGWTRMRLSNLTAGGRLSLEAPAYCAGARARLRRGDDYAITRERLFDDANGTFAGSIDSSRVNAALRAACPEITAPVAKARTLQ